MSRSYKVILDFEFAPLQTENFDVLNICYGRKKGHLGINRNPGHMVEATDRGDKVHRPIVPVVDTETSVPTPSEQKCSAALGPALVPPGTAPRQPLRHLRPFGRPSVDICIRINPHNELVDEETGCGSCNYKHKYLQLLTASIYIIYNYKLLYLCIKYIT